MSEHVTTSIRTALPEKLARQVQSEFMQFAHKDMTGYTFERTKSQFYEAKADLAIYDGEGNLVLHGRDFGSRTFFWQP